MTNSRKRRRRGNVTLEAVLALPVAFIVTLAIFQFGLVAVVHQVAVAAANDGVRVASQGGDLTAVRTAVDRVLSAVNLAIGANASVRRRDSSTSVTAGSPSCPELATPTVAAGEIRVSVCIDMTAPPLLNALAKFGLSFSGKRLEVRAQTAEE